MAFDWKRAINAVVKHVPVVRQALGATIAELENNPEYLRFVTKYQQMNPDAECVICMAHKYCVEMRLTASQHPPPHVCQDLK